MYVQYKKVDYPPHLFITVYAIEGIVWRAAPKESLSGHWVRTQISRIKIPDRDFCYRNHQKNIFRSFCTGTSMPLRVCVCIVKWLVGPSSTSSTIASFFI
jgi:hypothetical protein